MSDRPDLTTGDLLDGRFRLLVELGSSRLASVWRGHDEHLQREVLITLLAAAMHRDPEVRERFRREAGRVAALTDLVFPAQFDVVVDDEASYVVSEYVPGISLPALGGAPDLSPSAVAAVGQQLAWGLADAHASDLPHRCLRPRSVRLGEDGRARIVDMAAARLGQSLQSEHDLETPEDEYVAPEQSGDADGDHRSDVYALGRVLADLVAPAHTDGGVLRGLARRMLGTPRRVTWTQLREILEEMCAQAPECRPTAARVCERLGDLTSGREELLLQRVAGSFDDDLG